MTTHKPKIGLVIGSGGIKCAAALGLLEVLQREHIAINMAVGCSGGCFYAGSYALGKTVEEIVELNKDLWLGVFSQVSYRTLGGIVSPQLFGYSERHGILDDTKVNASLRKLFGTHTFTETRIPFFAVATELKTSREVILSEGSLFDAVRASAAMPLLLPPWEVNGQLLMDGGMSDPLPISVAIRENCDIILAMGFDNPPISGINSFNGHIEHFINSFTNNLIKSTFAFYNVAHHAEVIPMMPTFERNIDLGDTSMMPRIIEAGKQAAEEQLPYLKKLLEV
jgi:NTE family protein